MSFLAVGIRGRLLAGCSFICLLLAATVAYTAWAVSDVQTRFKRVIEIRAPIAIDSTQLVGNLYSTLSTLRGYLLTGDPQGKESRAAVWKELDRTAAEFEIKAANFTTADYLRLADGARFTAIPGASDAAISSAPVAEVPGSTTANSSPP